MSIDPGTQRLGWSISEISYTGGGRLLSNRIARGTVFGNGEGSSRIYHIVESVRNIQDQYKVTHLVIEDYQLIRGKTTGVFVVPALIGVLKNSWYERKGSEPIMVKAPTWKFIICNNGSAGKDMVVASLLDRELLSQKEYKQIIKELSANKRKRDMDPQDCFDAIAIDSFVRLSIERYITEEDLAIDGPTTD